ncbi:hypothetical protein jhhlp_004460 [Lomentospora prolificans]|uniref:Uncharacterized protein n=1 Tax=Lomentospora prolificans TaxID=41688 RepID=A0A2N3NBR8_9PEZI|nr:hypothetical protein jhhlp_004460 [Lomentospora prolificans]
MPDSKTSFDTTSKLYEILDEEGYPVAAIPKSTETDYFYYKERVVDKMPEKKVPRDPESALGKLKGLFKPPVVKAHERLPKREGKFYHIDNEGKIIETTVRRAYLKPGLNAFGGDFKRATR